MDRSHHFIEDLSYSNLVNLIQKDEAKAKEALNKIASEMDLAKAQVKDAEQKLNHYQSRIKSLMVASHQVCNMIERPIPLAVINDKAIVVVGERDITIESNII